MKRKTFTIAMVALMLALGFSSCSDDEKIVTTPVQLGIELPMGISDAQISNGQVTMTNVNSNEVFTSSDIVCTDGIYSVNLIDVPEGTYNVEVSGDLTFVKDGVNGSAKIEQKMENVEVSAKNSSVKMSVNTFNAQGGFLLSEIFFTGTTTLEGKQYSDDQYVIISNNSDVTLYADSIAFLESAFMTVSKEDYTPDIMNDTMSVDAIYMIPGDGKSVPVEPGKSLVLAINAKDHREANDKSFDLSGADFEFYDESSNVNYLDEDNTNVPNLDKWYCYTKTWFGLHNRGFHAYAIARMKENKEAYLDKYFYNAAYKFVYGQYSFDMKTSAYKIPNSWVLDAVNLSIESMYEWQVTSAALDAGWAHCGSVDRDANRYNKAVVRKVVDRKWVDTNNSTNDFESDAKPSLLK